MLCAVPCVVERMKVTGVAQRGRPGPDADSCLIHHVEHMFQAASDFAHEISDRTGLSAGRPGAVAERERRVRRAALTHLVVEACERDIVAIAEQACTIGKHPRDDEQRDALGTCEGTGGLGEHEMDDVLRQFTGALRDRSQRDLTQRADENQQSENHYHCDRPYGALGGQPATLFRSFGQELNRTFSTPFDGV